MWEKLRLIFVVFRCILASLYEGLFIRPAVTQFFFECAKTRVFDFGRRGEEVVGSVGHGGAEGSGGKRRVGGRG